LLLPISNLAIESTAWFPTIAASLLRRLREAWRETELLRHGKRIHHDGVFENLAVTNGVDVDRQPLDAVARAGTSEETRLTNCAKTDLRNGPPRQFIPA
jgi:hypothetical protein